MLSKLLSKFLYLLGKGGEHHKPLGEMQTLILFRIPFSKIICCILGSAALFIVVINSMKMFNDMFSIDDNENVLKSRINFTEEYVMFPAKLNIHIMGPFKNATTSNDDLIQEKYFVKRICKNLPYDKIMKCISLKKIIVLDHAFHEKLPINDDYLSNHERDLVGTTFPLFIEKECDRSNGFEIIDKKNMRNLKIFLLIGENQQFLTDYFIKITKVTRVKYKINYEMGCMLPFQSFYN